MRGLCLRAGDESNSLLLLDAPVQKPEPGFGSGVEATLTQRVSLQITDSTLIQLSIHCPNLQALVSLNGGDSLHPTTAGTRVSFPSGAIILGSRSGTPVGSCGRQGI